MAQTTPTKPCCSNNINRGAIVVHQVYNNHTKPLHKGWAPYTVGLTPCEGVLYDSCTLVYNYHYSY
jgi:hypothetical protein